MRDAVSTVLEVLGILAVVAGFYFIDWRLALIAAGLALVVLGMAVSRPAVRYGPDAQTPGPVER